MHDKDSFDLLLDSALTTYAAPRAGLEVRVLNALHADRHTHRRKLAWTIALPIAACVLLLWLAIPKTIHAPSVSVQRAQQTNHPSLSSSSIPQDLKAARGPFHPSRQITRLSISSPLPLSAPAAIPAPLPKLDVFPTPQPLTEEERTLAFVATQAPPPLRKALVEAQADDIPPLRIATVHIPPLEPPDEGQP